jgi:hypothetical protein
MTILPLQQGAAQGFYPNSTRVCERESHCRHEEKCVRHTSSWVTSQRCRRPPYVFDGPATLISYSHVKIDQNFLQITPCQAVVMQNNTLNCHRFEQTAQGIRELIIPFTLTGLPVGEITLEARHLLGNQRTIRPRFGSCDYTIQRSGTKLIVQPDHDRRRPFDCDRIRWNGKEKLFCENGSTIITHDIPKECLDNLGADLNMATLLAPSPDVFDGPRTPIESIARPPASDERTIPNSVRTR